MVKLKEFIAIAPDIIIPEMCSVMIETLDEDFGKTMNTVLRHFTTKSQLEKYYEYEIFGFDQEILYGEVDEQYISLRANKSEI